jgi:hypothetical protein
MQQVSLLSMESLFELEFATTITTTDYNYEKSGLTFSPKRRTTPKAGELSAHLWIVPAYTFFLRLESFSSKQYYRAIFRLRHQDFQEG